MNNKGLKILVMGLPTSGKTTLAKALRHRLRDFGWYTVHYNADEVRSTINCDLGFTECDRLHQAYSMGWLADKVANENGIAICDFVCPTEATRKAFHKDREADFLIWCDRVQESPYQDTNRVFEPPKDHTYDFRVYEDCDPNQLASLVMNELAVKFNKMYLAHL